MTENLDIISNAKGIGSSTLEDFKDAGFESAEDVGSRTPEEIADKVNGVGYTTAISVLKYLENKGYRDTSNRDDDLEQLVELLQDLFEFDNKNRDFGIYKLMNANREEIDQYIKEDLVDKIENEVETLHKKFGGKSIDEVKEEVIEELGAEALDGDTLSDKAQDKIEQRTDGVSEEELENVRSEIYNHIYQFFSNYYDSGDFITRRKRTHHSEPYSIPYDGSNTNFHWVTKNQYYAKTSEQFTRFTFNTGGYKICFKTVEDELDESGIGNDKYFVMEKICDIEIQDNSIVIPFYHRMINKNDLDRLNVSSNTHNKQSSMNKTFSEELTEFLQEKNIKLDANKLRNKIDEYTTRNQSDFFIHKNIQTFLNNELEEYVKSEIAKFEPENGLDSITKISIEKSRIVTNIILDIISFISQFEEFKKKIFKKKKFIKKSNKIIQVKNISDDDLNKLINNEKQLKEWERTYNIDPKDLSLDKLTKYPYNCMMIDTRYFNTEISKKEELKNKLIKGDNYQTLNFIQEKYCNSVKCIYIDPPYNTGNPNFAYKDKYQRPSWLSMMYDRLKISKNLLSDDGVIFVSIDDNEIENMKKLLNQVFGKDNNAGTFVWKRRTGSQRSPNNISTDHEYVLCYSKTDEFSLKGEKKSFERYSNPDNDPRGEWVKGDLRINHTKNDRPTLFYDIKNPETGNIYECKPDSVWRYGEDKMKKLIDENRIIFPEDENGVPKLKRFKSELKSKFKNVSTWIDPVQIDNDIVKNEENIRNITILRTGLTGSGTREVRNIFGEKKYDYPKPVELIKELIEQSTEENDIVLDFFAGSGTTAQAITELNRERDEQVNYILVEMLDKAYDITKERVQRTAYTKEWKDGKPQVQEDNKKPDFNLDVECIELESYEDALDAIEFNKTQRTLTGFNDTVLNYLLEFGTKDSPVMLDTEKLSKPLEYEIDGSIESSSVDVMTTFNYLIGLQDYKKETKTIENVDYTLYKGNIDNDNVLVIWRHNSENASYKEEKENINTSNYDKIYVNGDSALDNSQPIAPTFKKKMMPDEGDLL